ncbi:MAG: DUF1292 domain-containing protein [Clostridia bacterium]
MNEQYEADLITLIDDDNNEHEFEIVDEIDTDDGHFLALMPTDNNDLADPDTYYIFEIQEDENGDEQILELEDEELLSKLSQIFETRFEEAFYEDEEEDKDKE